MAGSDMQDDFATIIRKQLKRCGITQAQFGKWVNTQENSVCRVLNGHEGLSFERATRWAAALGIELKIVARLKEDGEGAEYESSRTCRCDKSADL